MKTVELSVPSMSCGHCVATVQAALSAVRGVAEVDVSLPAKKATVRADDAVADGALVQAVERAGYPASVR
jgi:copper chaperone CopZ